MKLALAIIFLALLAFDTFTAFACDGSVQSTDFNAPLTTDAQSPQQASNKYSDLNLDPVQAQQNRTSQVQ